MLMSKKNKKQKWIKYEWWCLPEDCKARNLIQPDKLQVY